MNKREISDAGKLKKVIAKWLLCLSFFILTNNIIAQSGPGGVPDDPSLPSSGSTPTNDPVGNPSGGSADIGTGLLILMGLGAAYGGMKLYKGGNKKD